MIHLKNKHSLLEIIVFWAYSFFMVSMMADDWGKIIIQCNLPVEQLIKIFIEIFHNSGVFLECRVFLRLLNFSTTVEISHNCWTFPQLLSFAMNVEVFREVWSFPMIMEFFTTMELLQNCWVFPRLWRFFNTVELNFDNCFYICQLLLIFYKKTVHYALFWPFPKILTFN